MTVCGPLLTAFYWKMCVFYTNSCGSRPVVKQHVKDDHELRHLFINESKYKSLFTVPTVVSREAKASRMSEMVVCVPGKRKIWLINSDLVGIPSTRQLEAFVVRGHYLMAYYVMMSGFKNFMLFTTIASIRVHDTREVEHMG